jgi:membrane protein YqaA with SNARE-associated domain
MQDFVRGVVEFVSPLAQRLGGPGLALVALLDSSFLSLPEVNDVLIVLLVIQHPERWLYYAGMTTLGSVAGCFALYSVGRRGGEAFLRRRFQERRLQRGLALFRRWGVLAVIVPSILPPPTPFKIFVLLAGAAKVPRSTFLAAAAAGRGFRYGSEALLAYWYGEQATQFIRENLPAVSIVVAVLVLAAGVAYFVWRRRAGRAESAGQQAS